MASRIIHLAICKQLEEALEVKNVNRFRIGSILPDAIIPGQKAHETSHYKLTVCEGKKRIIDFTHFYKQFSTKLLKDDLYLGYYFHLIEDAVYRKFIYCDYKFANYRGQEFYDALHKDYEILNSYLVKTYKLADILKTPEHFAEDEINNIYPFILDKFILDMTNDYNSPTEGKTKYFTEAMAEEFIRKCFDICKMEFEKIQTGKPYLDPYEFAWDKQ